MRILFVLHQFYPEFSGGTERVTLGLAQAAQRAGHYVHVITSTVEPSNCGGLPSTKLEGALHTVYHGVPVTFLPRRMLPATADYSFETDAGLVGRLAVWIGQEGFDLAHVLHPMRMGSALLAIQQCNLPYVLTLTDFFFPCFLINLVNLSQKLCTGSGNGACCADDCLVAPWTRESLAKRYQQARGILAAAGTRVCPSEYVAKRYREEFPDLEVKVIPHGIDFLALASGGMSTKVEAENKGMTIGFVGSIVQQKGLDMLLRAFARVSNPALRLRVIGGIYGSSYYADEVRRLAKDDKRVELIGQLPPDQVFKEMQSLDLLCVPSRVPETYSLVLHEAGIAGVPALVTALGAPGEHVARYGGGRSLPPDDVEAWAATIAELAGHPEILDGWRQALPLPLRIEEEAFFYESLYKRLSTAFAHE